MESKTIATNKKAFRDFAFQERWECGIELKGAEVKSLRAGEVNFKDSFARVEKNQIILYSLHISPYAQASYMNLEPDRPRRLLMHKREINKLEMTLAQKRLALVPTKIYFNKRGLVKIELGLGRGKKLYDKREDIKKRDFERELNRAARRRTKRR